MSTVFGWDEKDMEHLLASCETDGLMPYIDKYMPEGSYVLESGCGLGRYVKYLQDRERKMVGLEINSDAVKAVKKYWPDLEVIQGDAADSPFKANVFDGIISLGVIEHWTEGPNAPLKDIYRTLKPGGIALITVPCLNTVRKIKHFTWWNELRDQKALGRWLFHGGRKPNRLIKDFKFFTHPSFEDFFEYRFTKKEFSDAVKNAGLEIVDHQPSAIMDGFYHELNPGHGLVKFDNWAFKPTLAGRILNKGLSVFPFFHPHMQLIIARKPAKKSAGKS